MLVQSIACIQQQIHNTAGAKGLNGPYCEITIPADFECYAMGTTVER